MNMLKAIPTGRTEHDSEKVKELEEKNFKQQIVN